MAPESPRSVTARVGLQRTAQVGRRGGGRPRRIDPAEVPAWIPRGRFGPRRARVEQCPAVLRAEVVYDWLLCERRTLAPGWAATLEWKPFGTLDHRCLVSVEVRTNAVWRHGRLFFRCSPCGRLATRLYVPAEGASARCRRCWGLSYASQSWSYAWTGWLGRVLGPSAYATTRIRRDERRRRSQSRYLLRRSAQIGASSQKP